MESKLFKIEQEKLKFDNDNIRYFHLAGYTPEESLIIVARNSLQKLINSIIEKGFDYIHPLHINKFNIVRDGNTRLLALRIALGTPQLKKLVSKYKIKKYGELKNKINEIPVMQYENDDDLTRYVNDEHLTNERQIWTSAARYTFWYKQYTEGREMEFPSNIISMAKSVHLFMDAISFANDEYKELYEKSYEEKVSTILRAFQNIRLIHGKYPTNLAKIMNFHFNGEFEFKYNENISEDNYKAIVLEIANYVSNNGVGANIKFITENHFKKTYKILDSIFNLQEQEEEEEEKKDDADILKIKDSGFVSKKNLVHKNIDNSKKAIINENNLYPPLYNLLVTKNKISYCRNREFVRGWWERTIIENTVWVFAFRSFMKLINENDYEIIEKWRSDDERIKPKIRNLFLNLKSNLNTIESSSLSKMINEINKCFKFNDDEGNFFTKREQKFLKFLKTSALNYIDNLNQAAHGRWRDFDDATLEKKIIKEIMEMTKEWGI